MNHDAERPRKKQKNIPLEGSGDNIAHVVLVQLHLQKSGNNTDSVNGRYGEERQLNEFQCVETICTARTEPIEGTLVARMQFAKQD